MSPHDLYSKWSLFCANLYTSYLPQVLSTTTSDRGFVVETRRNKDLMTLNREIGVSQPRDSGTLPPFLCPRFDEGARPMYDPTFYVINNPTSDSYETMSELF